MTNFERDIEKIREISAQGYDLAMEDGELKSCGDVSDCVDCEFYDGGLSCSGKALMWLLEDDGEPSLERKAGQNEAWKLAGKIIACECDGGYSGDMIKDAFGTVNYSEVFCKNTYAEATEKVIAWENSKRIKAGQVWVVNKPGVERLKIVITAISKKDVYILHGDGSVSQYCVKDFLDTFAYTGYILPVGEWIKQIGGAENETED